MCPALKANEKPRSRIKAGQQPKNRQKDKPRCTTKT